MVKKIQINMSNKSFYMFVMVGLMVLAVGVVYAFNSPNSNPAVMGHSIDEIEGLSSLMDNYYTKEQINAMISAIETGGGCPVSYMFYEQSTETAKCYKDGEVISGQRGAGTGFGQGFGCKGRVLDGVLQSRANWHYGGIMKRDSGWVNDPSTATVFYNGWTVYCSVDWDGINGSPPGIDHLHPVSFGNILQIK